MSASSDADRYGHLELELACPTCQSSGLIPWQHLDRVLYCYGCAALFRVEPQGLVELEQTPDERISIKVRSGTSAWHEERAVLSRPVPTSERLRDFAVDLLASQRARWFAICGLLLVIGGLVWQSAGRPALPPTAELPASLDERTTLFAAGVVRRDTNLLIRLTDPSQHRALRIWLAHAKDLPRVSPDDADAIEATLVSKAKTTAGGEQVDARVRLRLPGESKEFVLAQNWIQKGDVWYFRPLVLRSAAQAMPMRSFKKKHSSRG